MDKPRDVVSELRWRGLLNQVTDEKIGDFLLEKPRIIYTGFDPTGPSLHVGHLVAIMNLRRFQMAGHRPIALLGGSTRMIGDPSGKSEERQLLTPETVEENVRSLRKQMVAGLERLCPYGDHPAAVAAAEPPCLSVVAGVSPQHSEPSVLSPGHVLQLPAHGIGPPSVVSRRLIPRMQYPGTNPKPG